MNLEVKPDIKYSGINKQVFKLKSKRHDGLILQVHHTVPTDNGEMLRVRFLHIAFDETGEMLAASDHRGNVFIIDLISNKFWLLPNLGSCTAVAFNTTKRNELLIATVNSSINLMNIELGILTGKLEGHAVPPRQITFSSTGRYCLTASTRDAMVWDLDSNTQIHRLSLHRNVVVRQVVFMPVSDNILTCFQDDGVRVWKFDTFECIKEILPEVWKSHHLKSFAFTRNGRAMVIGGHSPLLVVFCLDAWCVKKVIQLPEDVSGVRHIEFIPQLFDAGANKILGLLSSHCVLYFLDVESSLFLKNVFDPQTNIYRFTCSCSGKYVACILQSGEVNIYQSSQILEAQSADEHVVTEKAQSPAQNDTEPKKKMPSHHKVRHSSKQNLLKVHEQSLSDFRWKEMLPALEGLLDKLFCNHQNIVSSNGLFRIKETLDLNRLRPILKEYGEYPDSYRSLIWRTILQIPYNQPSYMSLIKREVHPAYLHLEEQYPLENRSVLMNLKRLLSCLAHWSSVFAEVKFLPLFVFPFVKVFQNDPFVCFEAVATIILNWCQHWFEYFPFPPINVLSMIENVLSEHDSALLAFYYDAGIKTDLYAWTLLEMAFSEVLTRSDWLCLWDHVLSNEPSFLLMAAVSFNIVCRRTVMSCRDHNDFEYFFHNQNPIDMKKFISMTYMLCSKTSKEVHPRQYLTAFRPLEKGSYPVFNQYPKFIIDYKAQKMEQIRKEEENIVKEYHMVMKQKAEQEKRMHEAIHTELQEERLKDLEEAYQEMLNKEEERVAEQRRKVLALRQNLRVRELELLDAAKDRLIKQHVEQRYVGLNRLLDDIKWKRAQEEREVDAAEEDIQQCHLKLLSHKHNLEQQLGTAYSAVPPASEKLRTLQQQQEQLTNDLRKLRSEASLEHHAKQRDIVTRVAELDKLLQRAEWAKVMAEREHNLQSGQNNVKVGQYETEAKKLEQEVEKLLERLTEVHLQERMAKLDEVAESQADGWAVNREQEEPVQLQQSIHPERPQELRQQGWNSKQNQQRAAVPSGLGTSLFTNMDTRQDKRSSTSTKGPQPIPLSSILGGISVRSDEFYRREQDAVKAAMDVREQIVSESGIL